MPDKENNTTGKKIKSILGNYIGYWAVAIIVIAFFVIGLINPFRKDSDVLSILVSSALLLFLGISITSALIYQALLDGDKHDKVIKARQQVNLTYNSIKDKSSLVDIYVMHKNRTAQKEVIYNCLRSENLEYSNHFKPDGTFKYDSFLKINDTDSKFVKKDKIAKNKMLKELAKGVKITTITRADVLCQEETTTRDPLKRAKSEKKFVAEENGKMVFSKIFSAILGGCYGATIIGLSWGEILYKVLWAAILIVMAIVSYMKTFRYKTVDYVSRLNQSAEWMDEFGNMVKTKELDKLKTEYDRVYYINSNEEENTDKESTLNTVEQNIKDKEGAMHAKRE